MERKMGKNFIMAAVTFFLLSPHSLQNTMAFQLFSKNLGKSLSSSSSSLRNVIHHQTRKNTQAPFFPTIPSASISVKKRILDQENNKIFTQLRMASSEYNVEKSILNKFDKKSKTDDNTPEELDWEQFEFGDSPKQDTRFADNSRIIQHADDSTFNEIVVSEVEADEKLKKELDEHNAALLALDPALVKQATDILQEFVTDTRIERLEEVLGKRTQNCRFLFENPGNPSNVWACLRTVDSFGIQNVDIVVDSSKYTKKAAIAQKHSTRTAMGSAKWVTLHSHSSTASALKTLREQGYKIYASDLNPNSKDIRDLDWECNDDGSSTPICIVMGNEDKGISEEMREGADETFTLPMVGFAESFNLSVATAITLAHLSAKGDKGPIKAGDLDEHEVNCLRLKWMMNSLAQKRMGKALLRKHGVELPKNFDKV